MAIVVTEASPLITTIAFDAHPSDRDVHDFIAVNRALLAKQVRHCTVVDMRLILEATPLQRKLVANYVTTELQALKMWRVGTAFVVSSSLVRGIVAAVMWLQRPPYEWKLAPTVNAGIAWCEEQLSPPEPSPGVTGKPRSIP